MKQLFHTLPELWKFSAERIITVLKWNWIKILYYRMAYVSPGVQAIHLNNPSLIQDRWTGGEDKDSKERISDVDEKLAW